MQMLAAPVKAPEAIDDLLENGDGDHLVAELVLPILDFALE